MKKTILILFFISFTTHLLFSQITIREEKIVEKPFSKPIAFDSLTNIVQQRNIIDYKKYIGYKLFFLPKSNNYSSKFGHSMETIDYLFDTDTIEITKEGKLPFDEVYINKAAWGTPQKRMQYSKQYKESLKRYENIDKEKTNIYKPKFYHQRTDKSDGKIYGKIATLPDSVEGKYFTILDIKGKTYRNKKHNFKKLEDIDLSTESPGLVYLKITLKNESNKDTLYWVAQARDLGKPFFLVPYFEKQKNFFLNKNLVLKDKNRTHSKLQELIDVNTGKIVNIAFGEVWTCSDVSFIESKDSYYISGFYFLKKNEREIKIPLESNLIQDYFILESEFKEQELEKQKKQEQKLKEQKELELRRKQAHEKFIQDCIAKWGNDLGGLIAHGKVKLGMNKEMCTAAWGSPININSTIVKGLVSEQWVYGWGTYLYFDNNILTAIQN